VERNSEIAGQDGKVLWHIALALTYEGGMNDSCEDGVEKIKKALNPLIANGSGIKQLFLTSLPRKA